MSLTLPLDVEHVISSLKTHPLTSHNTFESMSYDSLTDFYVFDISLRANSNSNNFLHAEFKIGGVSNHTKSSYYIIRLTPNRNYSYYPFFGQSPSQLIVSYRSYKIYILPLPYSTVLDYDQTQGTWVRNIEYTFKKSSFIKTYNVEQELLLNDIKSLIEAYSVASNILFSEEQDEKIREDSFIVKNYAFTDQKRETEEYALYIIEPNKKFFI